MKRRYLASGNHSSRFSLTGSDAGRGACAPGMLTIEINAARTAQTILMAASEIQTHGQLDDARRARRAGDADRRAEVRVDLRTCRVEPCRAVDVLELDLVEQIVDLGAELR